MSKEKISVKLKMGCDKLYKAYFFNVHSEVANLPL